MGHALLHDQGVVFEDVGKAARGQNLAPEVVGLEAVEVGGIARAVVVPLVERQEPRAFALEFGAHPHFAFIHGEVHHTAAEGKEWLARVAIALVLLHGIGDGLLGEAVLELEAGHGQAVDEQAQVEGAARLVIAVGELARYREAVLGVP